MRWPVTVKAVILRDGCVLLGRNSRREWELPGGRMEPGESIRETLIRELQEEAGILVSPGDLVLAEPFEVLPGETVFVVAYVATAEGQPLTVSHEHDALEYLPLARLSTLTLPEIYRSAIAAAGS